MAADRLPTRDAVLDGKGPRAYAIADIDAAAPDATANTARRCGFDSMLALAATAEDPDLARQDDSTLSSFARAAHNQGLLSFANISPCWISSTHELVARAPHEAFGLPPPVKVAVVDPRRQVARVRASVRLRRPDCIVVRTWWQQRLACLRDLGFDGFALVDADSAGAELARWLTKIGYRIELFRRARASASVSGKVLIDAERADSGAATLRIELAFAAFYAEGWAIGAPASDAAMEATEWLNSLQKTRTCSNSIRLWTGTGAPLDIRTRPEMQGGLLLVHNRAGVAQAWPPKMLPPLPWQQFAPAPGFTLPGDSIPAGQTVLFRARALPPVGGASPIEVRTAAMAARRVVISSFSPTVDEGAFPVKVVVGDRLDVNADIFTEGHEQLAAQATIRADDETAWQSYMLRPVGNDVWHGEVRFARLGRYSLCVEAWLDGWGGFTRDLALKRAAGQNLGVELREGRGLIMAATQRADATTAAELEAVLESLELVETTTATEMMLAASLTATMERVADRRFMARSFVQPIQVEREAARFSSWYEMFPRSQSGDPVRHGTFRDTLARLPHVAAMGFDTLYFPPIHPIGARNRKGRNNSLWAAPEDVGSPYAIGSAQGGHDAIHPELGSLEDFHDLVAAAAGQRIEIALDFAIQCAPDHPWLTEHPGWFSWRPDGSIRYAENPPKRYQDIVNVDFYGPDAVPDLWLALRDVVLFWISQGVKTFRVDNPHTKPFSFWEWIIGDVKAAYPDALFLSEAFTRPKPMQHLAKLGFSQSYTYFTWRNDKAALTAYLLELTQTDVQHYFRPHFFVNTPDINPIFLQTSGRSGFLIRAALAATLSGLWGMYAGFELCEAAALPGREEYLDSEKYELRARPDRAPGDIVDEITQLNRLRRAEPALQSHLGLEFHNAFNDNVLYYSKTVADHANRILIAVNLDPHGVQEADFEVPLWLFGRSDTDTMDVQDLLTGARFVWTGKMQHLRLTPDHPYAIWRISAEPEDVTDV